MIFFTSVAEISNDVRETRTLSIAMIARSGAGVSSQNVAHAILAILFQGVTEVSRFAILAIRSIGIVETLQTSSGVRVAISRSREIGIVTAFARRTAAVRIFGIAVIILGAGFTPRSRVTFVAFANYVVGDGIEATAVRV